MTTLMEDVDSESGSHKEKQGTLATQKGTGTTGKSNTAEVLATSKSFL